MENKQYILYDQLENAKKVLREHVESICILDENESMYFDGE